MCKSGRGCLQEGGDFPIYFFIFEGGGLNKILSKYMGEGVAYKKGAVYKSEYGNSSVQVVSTCHSTMEVDAVNRFLSGAYILCSFKLVHKYPGVHVCTCTGSLHIYTCTCTSYIPYMYVHAHLRI